MKLKVCFLKEAILAEKPLPICQVMAVCDTVIEDSQSKKKTLVGLFDSIRAKKFPAMHPSLNVFVSLADGIGDYECTLRFVMVGAEERILGAWPAKVQFEVKAQRVEVVFQVAGIVLPVDGLYRFDFVCGNRQIASRKFLGMKV